MEIKIHTTETQRHRGKSSKAWVMILMAAGAVLGIGSVLSIAAEEKTEPTIEELRAKLSELEEKERQARKSEWEIPWEADLPMGVGENSGRFAVVEIANSATVVAGAWTFRSLGDPTDGLLLKPIRCCLDFQGSEKILLPPGEWEINFRAGVAGSYAVAFEPKTVRLAPDHAYRTPLDANLEQRLQERFHPDQPLPPNNGKSSSSNSKRARPPKWGTQNNGSLLSRLLKLL